MTKCILCINPNSSSSVTESIGRSCDLGINASVELSLFQAPPQAPPSIDDFTTSVISAAACYPLVVHQLSKYDAFIVACYSDHPLTRMLREGTLQKMSRFSLFETDTILPLISRGPVTDKPVLGILEAGARMALREGHSFGVVTTGEGWIEPLTKANLEILDKGEKGKFAGVVATGLGVLEFHPEEGKVDVGAQEEHVHKRIGDAARKLAEAHHVDTIVLGCAGMEGMEQAILDGVAGMDRQIQVVDAVRAATELLCEELVGSN